MRGKRIVQEAAAILRLPCSPPSESNACPIMYQNRNNPANSLPRAPVVVVGVPSITVDKDRLVVGNANSSSSFFLSLSLPSSPFPRFHTLVHHHQVSRRWLLWYSMALRLARHPSSQYTALTNAVRGRCTPGVGRQAARGSQAHEATVGRRLGGMSETQGAPGAHLGLLNSSISDFPPIQSVTSYNPFPS